MSWGRGKRREERDRGGWQNNLAGEQGIGGKNPRNCLFVCFFATTHTTDNGFSGRNWQPGVLATQRKKKTGWTTKKNCINIFLSRATIRRSAFWSHTQREKKNITTISSSYSFSSPDDWLPIYSARPERTMQIAFQSPKSCSLNV